MVSLRRMVQCLGLSGSLSVVHDFLGYHTQFSGRNISLLRQVRLLQNRYINLNIIRVGSDNFLPADREAIGNAIQITRNIYATVNLGIGRLDYYDITVANSSGRDVINNDAEASSLTDEWTLPNASLDVFFVLNSWPSGTAGNITLGISATMGPCAKDSSGVMTGSVISIRGTDPLTLAHELGHYLGLPHVCQLAPGATCPGPSGTCQPVHITSLMHPCAIAGTVQENLSNSEGETMNAHCFVNSGCPSD
jgi:hypothetical protein